MITKKLILVDINDRIEFSLEAGLIRIESSRTSGGNTIEIQLEKYEVKELIKYLQCRVKEL